jgi:hypothetical protein
VEKIATTFLLARFLNDLQIDIGNSACCNWTFQIPSKRFVYEGPSRFHSLHSLIIPQEQFEIQSIVFVHVALFSKTNKMTTLNQIRTNEITDLNLCNLPEDIFDDLTELYAALDQNTTIETVRLDKDFIGYLCNETRSQVLEVIGKLPLLREVHIGDALLMVDGITKMIVQAKNLKCLTL